MSSDHAIGAVLAGIPQRGSTLGAATAPVTIQYFGDLQCPYCSQFTLGGLPAIIERWVRGGDLRVEYHALEAATRDPEVFMAQQVAALAAGRQDKAWHFIEAFAAAQGEENTGYVTESFLQNIAGQIAGLDLSRWIDDRSDPQLADEIAKDAQAAANAGVTGTPSFLIGKTSGAMTRLTPSDPSSFDVAVERLLTPAGDAGNQSSPRRSR
jgi:protein-disulfide isomerase